MAHEKIYQTKELIVRPGLTVANTLFAEPNLSVSDVH